MVEDVKHEATAVLGPVHSSHRWYVENHMRPKQFRASVQYPGTLFTMVVQPNLKHIQPARETLDVYCVDKSAGFLKIRNEYPHVPPITPCNKCKSNPLPRQNGGPRQSK